MYQKALMGGGEGIFFFAEHIDNINLFPLKISNHPRLQIFK